LRSSGTEQKRNVLAFTLQHYSRKYALVEIARNSHFVGEVNSQVAFVTDKKSGQVNTFVPASLMLITKITRQIYQVDIRVDFGRLASPREE
jgi:hypothetical protein